MGFAKYTEDDREITLERLRDRSYEPLVFSNAVHMEEQLLPAKSSWKEEWRRYHA